MPSSTARAGSNGSPEVCVLRSLRVAIRRREVWVVDAARWRNPEDDLPADFEDNRDIHYDALGQPQDPTEFIAALKAQMGRALASFEETTAAGKTGGVRIVTRRGEPWIACPRWTSWPRPRTCRPSRPRSNGAGPRCTASTSSRRPTTSPT